MSGFDEDPAAEFLAREQDELAGLEDEVKPAAVAVPTLNGDDPTNSASSFEMVENNDQEFAREKVNIPDSKLELDNDFDRVTPSPPKQENRVEPEKIRKWREEQAKRLEEKGKKYPSSLE
nr:unnamed protein product [Callosobruchus analis]